MVRESVGVIRERGGSRDQEPTLYLVVGGEGMWKRRCTRARTRSIYNVLERNIMFRVPLRVTVLFMIYESGSWFRLVIRYTYL